MSLIIRMSASIRRRMSKANVDQIEYLSGTFITCQRGANSCILRVFSIFRPEHQNFVP